jgi:hypothetical protein
VKGDRLPLLLLIEERILAQHDHQLLASSSLKMLPNCIWRERVIAWMYSVVDHLRESRSIVSVAISILDRYAAVVASRNNDAMDSQRYEVASMTALFLAVRVAGSGNLSVQSLLSMRRHAKIQSEDIVKVGGDMIKLLSWRHRLLTPALFLAKFLALVPEALDRDVGNSARYLIEMSVCDAFVSRSKPSNVAVAAILNVLRADAPEFLDVFVSQVSETSKIDALSDDISIIRRRLHNLYSLSYDSRRPDLPHVVLDGEDRGGDVAQANFHSSAAVRTISDDDLHGLWHDAERDETHRKRNLCSDDAPVNEAPRLKRVKTGFQLCTLC